MELLGKIIHELLEQTFRQPQEYITELAYYACFYHKKLQALQARGNPMAPPMAVPRTEPTDTVLNFRNPIIEAEATLTHIAANHEGLPRRHLQRELVRAEELLKDAKAILKSWASDPEAPGPVTLDGIDWALLEEGGIANMEEALQVAAAAAQRSSKFMAELISWLHDKLAANAPEGSPSPKRARREVATGSGQRPVFQHDDPGLDQAGAGQHAVQDPVLPALRELQRRYPLPRGNQGSNGDATPYQVLRAQQMIECSLSSSMTWQRLWRKHTATFSNGLRRRGDPRWSSWKVKLQGALVPIRQLKLSLGTQQNRGGSPKRR